MTKIPTNEPQGAAAFTEASRDPAAVSKQSDFTKVIERIKTETGSVAPTPTASEAVKAGSFDFAVPKLFEERVFVAETAAVQVQESVAAKRVEKLLSKLDGLLTPREDEAPKPSMASTMAIGEEDGGDPGGTLTSFAIGEEDGGTLI